MKGERAALGGGGGRWSSYPPPHAHRAASSSKFAGSPGAAANGSRATSPGVRAAIRAERAGRQPNPPFPRGSQPGLPGPGRGHRPPRGSGSVAASREGRVSARGRRGGVGRWGALGELSTLRSRGKNFVAAAAGARGRPCTPAAGAGGGWGGLAGRGCAAELAGWGRAVRVFVLVPSPSPRSGVDRREGGAAGSRVSDPHALLPKGASGAPLLLSSLLSPTPSPRWSGAPAPPPAEDGCPSLGGGRVIASAAPHSRCPFPSPALPAPPGCASPPPALPGPRPR